MLAGLPLPTTSSGDSDLNYIKQLEQDKRQAELALTCVNISLNDKLEFLGGAKFTGLCNGERKDWISTSDVVDMIRDIQNTITHTLEQ